MVLILPMLLMKDLSSLRFFSMGNLVILFYIIAVTLFQSPSYFSKYSSDPNYTITWFVKPLNFNWFSGFSTVVLSYMCQPNFFYIRDELVKPNEPRVTRVLKSAIALETLVYLCIAIAGYVSLGDTFMVPLFVLRPKMSKKNSSSLSKLIICRWGRLSDENCSRALLVR